MNFAYHVSGTVIEFRCFPSVTVNTRILKYAFGLTTANYALRRGSRKHSSARLLLWLNQK